MITFYENDFDYVEEFDLDGVDNYGYVDFWKGNDIIRVYVDNFEISTGYSSNPSDFNPNTGNISYESNPYNTISDIDVYTELTDEDGNIYTEEQFLEKNPGMNLDAIIKDAERYTKKLFTQWFDEVQ